ncbi:MAG: glycoside hydrolase family 13 protein [Chloroflexota bacterium]|nr:glycoside hydrolase family 13 protein [Chloroflexota bacterium]
MRDAVFYQIFPDRFAPSARIVKPGPMERWDAPPTVHGFKGGDLLGVVENLDHVQRLGANAIYLNPIFQSAANHRYHTYDYLAVDPLLGGNDAFRELLDTCHARGIRVVVDGVFNHASRGFWPFHHVLEVGRHSPYRDWFFFYIEDLEAGRPLRAYPIDPVVVDPGSVSDDQLGGRHSLRTLGYRAWWDLPALPKLNTDNPHVREYLLGVAEHWIRFGMDGWRLDVPEEVPERFWRAFRERVKAVNPDAYIVAEIWHEKPDDLRGDMYDAQMNYPLAAAILSFTGAGRLDKRVLGQHFTLKAMVRDDDGPTFAERLRRALSLYDPAVTAVQLNLLGSHDTPRFLSLVGGDAGSLRLATLIQMTIPGAPSIYYGDEIGLLGEQDPYCRGSFPWDHEEQWDRDVFAFISGAIAFRHANRVLRHGAFRIVAAVERTVAYLRWQDDDAVLVVVNAGDMPCALHLEVPELDGRTLVTQRWTGSADTFPVRLGVQSGGVHVELPPRDGIALCAQRP